MWKAFVTFSIGCGLLLSQNAAAQQPTAEDVLPQSGTTATTVSPSTPASDPGCNQPDPPASCMLKILRKPGRSGGIVTDKPEFDVFQREIMLENLKGKTVDIPR